MNQKIKTREIIYQDGNIDCCGFLAYPENRTKLPCVLVVHDWTGRDASACDKAYQLAQQGYVGFAVDMYGGGRLGSDKTEKRALMAPLRENRQMLAERILAAFHTTCALDEVNPEKIAAIGYCFGGLCVLDLARSGAPVRCVVSFHGLLTPSPVYNTQQNVLARVLVLHGYDDPLVPPAAVYDFGREMSEKNADWQVHMYGLTAHSFTNPLANDDEMGLHYREIADKRSWQTTLQFVHNAIL